MGFKCFEMYLRCFIHDSPNNLLSWTEFWYNNSTSLTPFKVVYRSHPPKSTKHTIDLADSVSLQEKLLTKDTTLHKLKRNLLKAQAHMKKFAGKKRQLEF